MPESAFEMSRMLHSPSADPELAKMYKLDIYLNSLEPNCRRKTICWRSRLESKNSEALREKIAGCFAEFVERDLNDKSGYELNIKIVGRRVDKNGKYCD